MLFRSEKLRDSLPTQQIELRVDRHKINGISLGKLSAETGLTVDGIRGQISPALRSGELLRLPGDLLLSRDGLKAAASAVMLHLKASHDAIKSSELRSQTGLSPEVFEFVLTTLVHDKAARLCDEMVSTYDAVKQSSTAEDQLLASIAKAYEVAGLASPSTTELVQRFNVSETEMRRIVTLLQRNKTIVRMGSDDLFIHSTALKQLADQLAPLRGSLIDIARFKQFTGLSRKYAIPLLEYLDRQRVTRKQGDQRLVV